MENIKKNIGSDEIIWSNIKLRLKDIYGESEYSNWLKLLTFSKVEKDVIIFYAPTKFMCDWILSHYGKKILSLWIEKNKLIKDIAIHVYNDKESKGKNKIQQGDFKRSFSPYRAKRWQTIFFARASSH